VIKGNQFLGIATTESDIGSDLGNMKTKIVKKGNK
jgi:alkylation response protein AidB-like acyl-CoA dehydrogenase